MCIQLLLVFDYGFLSDCRSLMQGIDIHFEQHFQAKAERGVCDLASSFFHFKQRNEISI